MTHLVPKLAVLIGQQRQLVDIAQRKMLGGELTELDNGSVVLQRLIDKLVTLSTTMAEPSER